MTDGPTDVLVAVYQDIDTATRDFDGLMQVVNEKRIAIEGAILVTHDADGEVTVIQHGDHLGRKGLGWGAGVGLVVGLFAPPLLGSVAVGAARGGLVGRFTDHKVRAGMESSASSCRPARRVSSPSSTTAIGSRSSSCSRGSPSRSSRPTRRGSGALKRSWPRPWASSAPTGPCCRSRTGPSAGPAGRTFKDSVADWAMIPGPKAPDGAPNVLIVLIDDAGYGGPDTFGGPIRTPAFTACRRWG